MFFKNPFDSSILTIYLQLLCMQNSETVRLTVDFSLLPSEGKDFFLQKC